MGRLRVKKRKWNEVGGMEERQSECQLERGWNLGKESDQGEGPIDVPIKDVEVQERIRCRVVLEVMGKL